MTTKKEEIKEEVEQTTEIAVQKEAAIVAAPEDRLGFENTDMSTITLGVAKLMQANSPFVVDDEYEEYGFKAGKVVHSVLLEELDRAFIPIMLFDDNILFSPREADRRESFADRINAVHHIGITPEDLSEEMIICRALDAKTGDRFGSCANCALNEFHGADKPICNKNINILALFEGDDMPVIIRFSSTSYKHGKQFKQMAAYSRGSLFNKRYQLVTKKNSNAGNTWYELKVKPAGMASEEDIALATALHSEFVHRTFDTAEVEDYSENETETSKPSY